MHVPQDEGHITEVSVGEDDSGEVQDFICTVWSWGLYGVAFKTYHTQSCGEAIEWKHELQSKLLVCP